MGMELVGKLDLGLVMGLGTWLESWLVADLARSLERCSYLLRRHNKLPLRLIRSFHRPQHRTRRTSMDLPRRKYSRIEYHKHRARILGNLVAQDRNMDHKLGPWMGMALARLLGPWLACQLEAQLAYQLVQELVMDLGCELVDHLDLVLVQDLGLGLVQDLGARKVGW